MLKKLWLPLISLAALPLCADMNKMPFPEFPAVREPLLLKPHPTLAIDKDGNWIVNGSMRFLLGTQVPSLFGRGAYRKLPGGDPRYAWLTDRAPDYQTCQRIGFDTLCTENPMTFMKELFPAFTYNLLKTSADGFAMEPGLPILMDYTCAPWNNGRAANRKGEDFHHPELTGALPDEAIVRRSENVWVPYSVFHPEGRRVYKAMWESGARLAREKKVPVLAYELFNEPMYNDMGPYARRLFVDVLRKKYGTPAAMNRRWGGSSYRSFEEAAMNPNLKQQVGLFVDYLQFLEDGFVDVNRMGQEAIRAIDPSARFCIQLKGLWHYRTIVSSATNLYKLNQHMQVVTVSTSGGIGRFEGYKVPAAKTVEAPSNPVSLFDGVMQRHFYRALADGKPMQNQEMYVGREYGEILSKLWLDYARGSAATYVFSWGSGATHWRPFSVEGGKRNAEIAPYTMLNPHAVPPENLPAIFQAKQEIFRFGELFLPRDRQVKPEIAVLFSYPTERASGVNGYSLKSEFAVYGGALSFSHYPVDVLFEEQLADGRQNRYRAIVAGGVRNVYPATLPALRRFVENGGILLMGREFMQRDEYDAPENGWNGLLDGLKFTDDFNAPLGRTVPAVSQPVNLKGSLTVRTTRRISAAPGWDVLAKDGTLPVLLRKKVGKGFLYLLTAEMPDYSLASILGSVLNAHRIFPDVLLRRDPEGDLPVNVEIHTARRGERTMYFLYNHDAYPKLATLESASIRRYSYLVNPIDGTRYAVNGGRARILIHPQTRILLGSGPEGSFREFGTFSPVDPDSLKKTYQKQMAEQEERRLAEEKKQFQYRPNLAKTYSLNLRAYANSPFGDTTPPNDGKGGWTDQGGGSSLRGVPWGTHTFLGVPCEIIRFDENDNRTCIVLKSKSSKIPFPESVRIPVNDNLKALYFFHTAAWIPRGKMEKGMDYEIRYASGKTEIIPVVSNENIWDWWAIRDPKQHLAAWKNLDAHGFFCWRWENPHPADTIRSITLRSANGAIIPIVIAISAEKYDPASEPVVHRGKNLKVYSYGGLAVSTSDPGVFATSATPETKGWSGFVLSSQTPYFPVTAENIRRGFLKFDLRGGSDKFGVRKTGQNYEICLNRAGAYGKKLFTGPRISLKKYLPEKKVPGDFREIAVPLKDLLPKEAPPEGCNQIGLRAIAIPEAGLELRNVRVEIPPES